MKGAAPIAARRRALARLAALFDLGKLRIVELWLGLFAGASLLGARALADGRALALLALILISTVAVVAATCGLDDVAGVRDGVDQANHRDGARWGVHKPVLDGRLTERQALGAVRVLGAIIALGYVGVLALSWPVPLWVMATLTAVVALALSYSSGPRLSYRGAGELVLLAAGAGTVLVPYGLLGGEPNATALFVAGLVGSWHAQVVVFSNTQDAEGDRAAGRMTIAARTSKRGNYVYILCTFGLSWALTALALGSGRVPRSYAVALAPIWAMQIAQLWLGVGREQWLRARRLGFRVVRLGVAALVLVHLMVDR